MRKVILAATALAFLSSTAFAQSTDKAGRDDRTRGPERRYHEQGRRVERQNGT